MKSVFCILSISILLIGLGCAHTHKVDGPQERTEIPAGIRVGIGGKEIREGDTLTVYKSSCSRASLGERGGGANKCHDNQVGSAVVLKILNDDSAIVSPQNGLVMDTSMKVEKQKGEQQ